MEVLLYNFSKNLCAKCNFNSCVPNNIFKKLYHHEVRKPTFGIFFDIDGVIVREKKVLPSAKEAVSRLVSHGKFRIPTVFVTNAGNALRNDKAKQLTQWLGVEVLELFLEEWAHPKNAEGLIQIG